MTSEQLALLFMKIDTSCDGRVDWNEFCSYMMLEYEKNQPQEHGLVVNDQIPVIRMQAHRESIVHMSFAPPKSWLDSSHARQLVTIDNSGCLCKWNTELTSPNQKILLELPKSRPEVVAVKILPNLNRCVVALMNRSLRFFELSCTSGMVCEIVGLEHSVLSMDAVGDKADQSVTLLLGDLGGFVTHLTFTEPKTSLFGVDGIAEIHFRDLAAGLFAPAARITKRKVHSDWTTKVMCCNARGMYVSCCSASNASLILGDKTGIISTFNVPKGVRAFDVNSNFNAIVTGGQDYLVRVWDKYITTRPCAALDGHAAPICSVALAVPSTSKVGLANFETGVSPHDLDGHQARVISVSIDQVLKVWDVTTQACLQTLTMHGLPGRLTEHMLLLSAERGLLFVGSSTILAYRLLHLKPPEVSESLSHNSPVSGAKYNPLFGQVVTACRGGVVNVWNLRTGEQMVQFREAHGEAEITSLTFDRTSRRLLTGASDGTVRLWNFSIGLCLRKLQSVSSTEVSGIVEMKNRAIVTAGWWRKLIYYRDQEDQYYIQPERSIQGMGHTEDIQCLEYCGGNVVATCSYDGVIIIWQVEMLSIKQKLMIETALEHPGKPSATDKLLFLEQRCRSRGGSLVAGGVDGWIRFWNIYSGNLVGAFQINDSSGDKASSKSYSVSALATSDANNVLATGDTSGTIKIWGIANYCCKQGAQKAGTPDLLQGWIAHAGPIVSLQLIEHQPSQTKQDDGASGGAAALPPKGLASAAAQNPFKLLDGQDAEGGIVTQQMLLSASADKTVRLWKIDGTLIGTFGQHEPWDIETM